MFDFFHFSNDWDIEEDDNGEKKILHFKWVSREELKNLDLKPTRIKELLVDNKIKQFTHLIDRSMEGEEK